MTETVLHIKGMRGVSCVGELEHHLRRVAGVSRVSVNPVTGQGTIVHDPAETTTQDLIGAVRRAGYDAVPDGLSRRGRRRGQISTLDQQTIVVKRWVLPAGAIMAALTVALAMLWPTRESVRFQFLLATPIQIILGYPFYRGAWRGLCRLRADTESLVALGASLAYFYSVVVMVLGGAGTCFDTAAVILVVVSLGRVLKRRAKHRVAAEIRSLVDLMAPRATVVRDGQEWVVNVQEVVSGDRVRVGPGQRVPVDGVVTEGRSAIDQAAFTGQSLPVGIGAGSTVFAGTTNQTGVFYFRATRTGHQTLLAQVVEWVKRAQRSKTHIQRLVDTIAAVFVPAVLVVALLTLVAWGVYGLPLVGLNATVAVLVVACPGALGLAAPMAIAVGTGLGARHGVLIKDAAALERAGRLTHIILDKTVMFGRLTVKQVVAVEQGLDGDRLLQLAASVEAGSEHPIARAIVEHARARGLKLNAVTDFRSTTGSGVTGRVAGCPVVVGRVSTLRDHRVTGVETLLKPRDALLQHNRTAVVVGVDGHAAGLIALADRLEPNAAQVVKELKQLGLHVMFMTGDHLMTAAATAQEVGIAAQDVLAQVMPADKREKIVELQKTGRVVAMVGDGINDAPALAAADVGIAIGGGADIAKDAGHIVLVGDDLGALPRAIRLSRATMRRVYGGLFWAFGYNLLLIPVAATGHLHPMLAAGAMSLSSVSVVLNALWLRTRWKP